MNEKNEDWISKEWKDGHLTYHYIFNMNRLKNGITDDQKRCDFHNELVQLINKYNITVDSFDIKLNNKTTQII